MICPVCRCACSAIWIAKPIAVDQFAFARYSRPSPNLRVEAANRRSRLCRSDALDGAQHLFPAAAAISLCIQFG